MGFILVPPNQTKVDVKVARVPGRVGQGTIPGAGQRADRGLAGRATRTRKLTLDDVQRNTLKEEGDRHAIVVDPTNRMLYEFYQLDARPTRAGRPRSRPSST